MNSQSRSRNITPTSIERVIFSANESPLGSLHFHQAALSRIYKNIRNCPQFNEAGIMVVRPHLISPANLLDWHRPTFTPHQRPFYKALVDYKPCIPVMHHIGKRLIVNDVKMAGHTRKARFLFRRSVNDKARGILPRRQLPGPRPHYGLGADNQHSTFNGGLTLHKRRSHWRDQTASIPTTGGIRRAARLSASWIPRHQYAAGSLRPRPQNLLIARRRTRLPGSRIYSNTRVLF